MARLLLLLFACLVCASNAVPVSKDFDPVYTIAWPPAELIVKMDPVVRTIYFAFDAPPPEFVNMRWLTVTATPLASTSGFDSAVALTVQRGFIPDPSQNCSTEEIIPQSIRPYKCWSVMITSGDQVQVVMNYPAKDRYYGYLSLLGGVDVGAIDVKISLNASACAPGFAGPGCGVAVVSREGTNNFPWTLNGTVDLHDYKYYEFHVLNTQANPAVIKFSLNSAFNCPANGKGYILVRWNGYPVWDAQDPTKHADYIMNCAEIGRVDWTSPAAGTYWVAFYAPNGTWSYDFTIDWADCDDEHIGASCQNVALGPMCDFADTFLCTAPFVETQLGTELTSVPFTPLHDRNTYIMINTDARPSYYMVVVTVTPVEGQPYVMFDLVAKRSGPPSAYSHGVDELYVYQNVSSPNYQSVTLAILYAPGDVWYFGVHLRNVTLPPNTTFAFNFQSYSQECFNGCSGKGECNTYTNWCTCDNEYSGPDCSTYTPTRRDKNRTPIVLGVLFGVVLPVILLAILGYIWWQKKMRDQYRPLN